MSRSFSVGLMGALSIALVTFARSASAQAPEPPLPPGAQTPAGPAPAPPSAVGADCFPPCREGYVCHMRQCVSQCNPPCPSGQVCVGGLRCEFAPAGFSGPIREPPLPPVRHFADGSFAMLGFHYGFSGNVETEIGSTPTSTALASTYGFNLRGDVPIERYLVLGPLIQFGTWRPDQSPAPSRSYYIDIDLYIRGRIPITTKTTNFQVWAGVPVGFTFDLLGPEMAGISEAGLGWNIGFLGGGAVHFTPKIGLFAELGWMQHKVTHGGDPSSYYVRLAQWIFNVGFVFSQ